MRERKLLPLTKSYIGNATYILCNHEGKLFLNTTLDPFRIYHQSVGDVVEPKEYCFSKQETFFYRVSKSTSHFGNITHLGCQFGE